MRRPLNFERTDRAQVPDPSNGCYYPIIGDALVMRALDMKTFNVIYRVGVETRTVVVSTRICFCFTAWL